MELKRLSAAAASLTLAAALAAPALGADLLIAPDPNAVPQEVDLPLPKAYAATLTLNGEELDCAGIPGAPAKMVPMRLLTESDGGYADWFEEEDQAFFYLADQRFVVNFTDLSVELDGEALEGVTAYLDPRGYTYLPASALELVEGVTVELNEALDVDRIDVRTPNGEPLNQLINTIVNEVPMAATLKLPAADLEEFYGVSAANFDTLAAQGSMNIRADILLLGRYAENADKAEAKAQFEAVRETIEKSFEHYLKEPYEMAQNGQVVESEDGAWLMLVISEDNAKAIELFQAGVAELQS